MKRKELSTYIETPIVYCKAFEDNFSVIELAHTPKLYPRTKHINLLYHKFREYIRHKEITIHPINMDEQLADVFTKSLAQNVFEKYHTALLKWKINEKIS